MDAALVPLMGFMVAGAVCLWWLPNVAGRTRSERLTRAEQLLAEMLTEDEYVRLGRCGYLEVPSPSIPGRVYRIPRHGGGVGVYQAGEAIMSLCIQPVKFLPDPDVVLANKLMIEGNEQEYLRTANRLSAAYHRRARETS